VVPAQDPDAGASLQWIRPQKTLWAEEDAQSEVSECDLRESQHREQAEGQGDWGGKGELATSRLADGKRMVCFRHDLARSHASNEIFAVLIRATTGDVEPAWTRAAVRTEAIAPQDRKMDRCKLSASLVHRDIEAAAEGTPIPKVVS